MTRQCLRILSPVVAVAVIVVAPAAGQVSGRATVESRVFPRSPLLDTQHRSDLSLILEPELYLELARGRHSFLFEPFLRLDLRDGRRTHWDVRALAWRMTARSWELQLGIRKVFWGVVESQHLVDIVNQTDLVENPDGEDKLGQLMVYVALIRSWGTVEFYLLPWFRERTFPGAEGRLRFPLPVATDSAAYQSGARRRHVDWAVRWSHTIGAWDLGLAHFSGTSREPRLVPGKDRSGSAVLIPHYDLIHQTSLDALWTKGGWVWKLEAMTRSGQGSRFAAFTGGFEYTLFGVLGTGADLGILAEYSHDTRGVEATTPFNDDLFLGGRLVLNDVQSSDILVGAMIDRNTRATLLLLEASRRLSDGWTLAVEARAFAGVGGSDFLAGLRKDHYLQIQVAWHF
ncbi:MAG: hypothetical protein GTN62_10580 [Gemmatimonadales bacterium]|nr:hypothetical protein [Gemmatimonadales bacterium]NIN12009.1 hypothetical protein [Gemmatimonadales bacterium]NIN50540.1 hypothetical protein [Gemmatimonadales bacterium]NIP08004.1 hypothetical protein [Gemmatimonadales bacterium]NIR00606.1 hypothetical protein [Gemmatimonadales bacterium]